jgi:hypothetical protein
MFAPMFYVTYFEPPEHHQSVVAISAIVLPVKLDHLAGHYVIFAVVVELVISVLSVETR